MESRGNENELPQRSPSPDRDLLREMSRRNRPSENLSKFIKEDYEENLKNFTKNKEENLFNTLKRDLFRESQTDSQFNQDLGRLIRQPTVVPRQPLSEAGRSRFSLHGLLARFSQAIELPHMGRDLKVDEESVPIDKGYTRIDFLPEERPRRYASKLTNSMANAIKGLTGLVAAIDAGEVDLEPVFVGTTNINMALISQRMGFKIVDSCRNSDGTIDKSRKEFTVVGRLGDVRQKLAEFAQSGLNQKILQRDARPRHRKKRIFRLAR